MVRNIAGVVAGLIVAVLTVMVVQAIGHQLYPYPADVDLRDPEQIAAVFPTIPVAAKLFVVAAWFGGALLGGIVAKLITGRNWAAWTIAVLIAVAGVMNLFIIPHPVWMQIAAVAAPLLGGLIATHFERARRAESPGEGASDARI